jgi:nucleoside-diphosphate-sugar epimerase
MEVVYTTGITGFIGKNLLQYLLLNYNKVINFTRNKTLQICQKNNIEEVTISSDFLVKHPSNLLINLATLYQPNPHSLNDLRNIVEANIIFPACVFDWLSPNKNLKVVNALSYHQLLDFKAQNVYSLSKELFKKFLDNQESEIVNLYIFDTFGSGDTRNKVVDIFIKNILTGNSISIPSNKVNINLADVQPVCKSILNSIHAAHGNYSLRSPNTISLDELLRMIMQISGRKVEVIRQQTGPNYFDEIVKFPENIFVNDADYSFQASLALRIKEIEDAI